jgi:hypothetical protein
MRKVLFVLLLLVVLVVGAGVGVGYYREWFTFTKSNPETGQTGVELKVDQDKIKSDVQKAKQKVSGAAQGQSQGN